MSTITGLATFTDGTVTAATPVMQNFYNPAAAPASLEGMNGWLDKQNVATGGLAWTVTREQIRPQSMTRGRMVGLTGHFDLDQDFSGDPDVVIVPISGATLSFYLPRAPKLVLLTWQVIGAGEELYGSPGDPAIPLKVQVDGALISSQVRYVAAALSGLGYVPRYPQRDRIWSGHATFLAGTNGLAAGWHEAAVVHVREGGMFARFRIRNMKYVAFF